MIIGSQINELVNLLNQRSVNLYHSCQFADFKSYLELGGISSRKKMTDGNIGYTEFETDTIDHENDVCNKVFLYL